MEANLKYRNLPNQYDLWTLDIISITRLKAKYGHVNATVQVVSPIYVMHINQSYQRHQKVTIIYNKSYERLRK
jgi:hypothetical protein